MSTVQLVDGREVDSASEEWRHECQARAIANLPTLAARRAWLEDLERKHGPQVVQRLRDTMGEIWKKEKARG